MERVLSIWTWYPSVLLGVLGLGAGYLWLVRGRLSVRSIGFVTGLLVLVIALDSPLDALGDSYLFSAHMLQHLLLILVVPPLLLLGTPPQAAGRLLKVHLVGRVERMFNRPLAAWWIGMGTVWLWHLPSLYNAALANENIHLIEHLSFLVTSTLFWWPVLAPVEDRRMKAISAVFYLFLAAVANSVLGILLAYASPGAYPAYQNPVDEFGILDLIRNQWGITPALDQQAGGLLMWIAGAPVYLLAAIQSLSRWYNTPEDQEVVLERR
jgi:putative membrane protein